MHAATSTLAQRAPLTILHLLFLLSHFSSSLKWSWTCTASAYTCAEHIHCLLFHFADDERTENQQKWCRNKNCEWPDSDLWCNGIFALHMRRRSTDTTHYNVYECNSWLTSFFRSLHFTSLYSHSLTGYTLHEHKFPHSTSLSCHDLMNSR